MKVLILEDDPAQADLLRLWLDEDHCDAIVCADCAGFIEQFSLVLPDLVFLDWHLPDGTGIDVLHHIRLKLESHVPVIFCTQRDAEEDIVEALNAGADEYLQKPVRRGELRARMRALIRRVGGAEVDGMTLGPITLDVKHEQILLQGEPVKLTRKDYLVAVCLIENVGKVLSREYLLKTVWGVESSIDTRKVDVHVSRVRRSLNIHPDMGFAIKNIYQHGYRLEKVVL